MKALSIPKQEHQPALLANHLKDDILTTLTVNIEQVCMWTDNTTVFQWLNSSDKLPAKYLTVSAKPSNRPLLVSEKI